MFKNIFIHAPSVHQGGGRSLLYALLIQLKKEAQFILFLDERMPIPKGMADNIQINRVKPTIEQRFRAEMRLAQLVSPKDIVLCFGSLPPLFKLRGYTVVFVQNRYLIDNIKLDGFRFSQKLRLVIERIWFTNKISNVREFVVQTPKMKVLLETKTLGKVPVRMLPFVQEPSTYVRSVLQNENQILPTFEFFYVASGEPHKNHRQLLEAWLLLANEGLYPSLSLTLDEYGCAELCREIELMRQQYGLKVKNLGVLPHQHVLALYKKSTALIYPSRFESLGLPLIEARQAGLPVLAPELDYVRDVIDPDQTFNPESSVSIARAVKRFMGTEEQPLPLLDATQFLSEVFQRRS